MTKFKSLAVVALFTAMTINSIPCGTGGTPKAPTPDAKSDNKGDGKAPATPRGK